MPLLVALILALELVEVQLETVGLGSSRSEVRLHAEVEAGLEAGACLTHLIVELLVEVG